MQRYNYTAYGKTKIEKTSLDVKAKLVDSPYGYTSREWEQESGDYYYRARNYDPRSGRFISEDPIHFDGGDENLYRYVGNNPVYLRDSSGLYYERPPASGYSSQVLEGYEELMRTYKEMLDRELANSDKYFHCLANCRAAKAGPGGADVAKLLSSAREVFQIPKDGIQACTEDMAANKDGQQAGSANQSCTQSCNGYKYNRLITPSPWY